MQFLLTLHSVIRWIIVAVGLIAVIKFLIGWARKQDFGKMDRGLVSGFSGLMDLQVTLGLIFFFWSGFTGAGFPMFRIEHMTMMIIAAVVGHLPTVLKKRPWNMFAIGLFSILGTLLLVYIGVAILPGGWSR